MAPQTFTQMPSNSELSVELSRTLKKMASLLTTLTPYDGYFPLLENQVHVARSATLSSQQHCLLALPSICIVPQGAKHVSVMQAGVEYTEDASTMVVYAAEVPLDYKIMQASPEEPYFCLMLPLNKDRLIELIPRVFPNGVPKTDKASSVYVKGNDQRVMKACVRLLELIVEQEYVDLLVPLAIDEILIRLLKSSVGPAIAQLGVMDSHAQKVSKAITWLKDHYAQPIKMEQLATLSGMSVSSFHTHFKSITSMSPLQYQKTVRLQHARHLIRSQSMDVSRAAFEVGYISSSQFSREYSRAFGVSPSRDVQPF
ncbi:AraC family transcriptional regulator [Marinomonas atlantica]|uniref:AraC family transcriptional regulator n=1 Tax=Marinomonas atlantica TaxID=1806668 RepID=UPI0009ED143D|nr:AraC family transcriptional regulator [Marinomonas atlantica]MCO4785085.1 AraC family transcriptional regulator [Marinomonas atlantica]